MDDHNILSYIFGFNKKYNKNICRVCKFWDVMYIKATKIYEIEIKFKYGITNKKFIELYSLPRFTDIIYLNIMKCKSIDMWNIAFTNLKILRVPTKISEIPASTMDTLIKLYIEGNYEITKLPNFSKLKKLTLYSGTIIELPISITNTLEELIIYHCNT